ncbi:MAG: UDP-glucose/GDP-mannose dehydrogenase family protein [Candidatus Krumholzibacteriota bacterium]|nr:UDP-glucose/GDP-mannose dehydrogenase family protein [Candidatus Krumholzibacteriota bacterium]
MVIGTGYVGLVSGACMADFGNRVICYDIDKEKIAALERGVIPFYEPGLAELVERNRAAGRLSFSTDLVACIADSMVIFIAVGTPEGQGGEADLSAVFGVAGEIGRHLDGYHVVVQKSTVPVGTNRRVAAIIREAAGPEARFDMVSNPEFMREGSAIGDFLRPNRVIMGVESERARELMREIYRPLFLNETPILFTGIESAEMIKYASNAFLAVKISYINEIAELCERMGADVQVVARGMGLDGRIGAKFLHAGAGFGGSCFPKDTKALVTMADEQAVAMGVVRAAIAANERQPERAVEKLAALAGGDIAGMRVAVLGLSFKPNTDDVREAASLKIIRRLREKGARERAFDPVAGANARRVLPDLDLAPGTYECLDGADALIIVTEWNEFRVLDLQRVAALLKRPLVVDCRNIFNARIMADAGLRYASYGQVDEEAR